MQGLNKKPSDIYGKIARSASQQNIVQGTAVVAVMAALNVIIRPQPVMATIFFSMIFVICVLDRRISSLFVLTGGIFAVYTLTRSQSLFLIAGLTVLITSFKLLETFREKTVLLVFSNLAHIGDALTTYFGVRQGLSEKNPVLNPLIENFGGLTIFPVKLIVLPVTLYIYFGLDEQESALFLKIIFFIGLYLTLGNALNMF